jgi:hypothetical protein
MGPQGQAHSQILALLELNRFISDIVKGRRNEECQWLNCLQNSMLNPSKEVPTLHFGIPVTVEKLVDYRKMAWWTRRQRSTTFLQKTYVMD